MRVDDAAGVSQRRGMRFAWVAASIVCLSVAGAEDEPAALQARRLANEAAAPAMAEDASARVKLLAEAVQLMPEHPRYLLRLAAAQVDAGSLSGAVESLARIADLGHDVDPGAIEQFGSLRDRDDFSKVVERFAALRTPVGAGELAFSLSNTEGLIEGIAWRRTHDDCFFGDVRARGIWRRSAAGEVTRFDQHDPRVLGVFGLKVDETRGVLWAAMSAVPEMDGYSPDMKGRAGIGAFDLETGGLRRLVLVPTEGDDHVVGDLVIDDVGSIYATDSAAPVIWRLAPDAETLERWVESPEFMGLQGLVFSKDNSAVVVAAYANGLLRVDRATRAITRLAAPAGSTLLGIDGVELMENGAIVAVQNGIAPPRLVRVDLDAAARSVRALSVVEAAHPALVDPTLLCRTDRGLLVIGDAGWRLFEGGRSPESTTRDVPVVRVSGGSEAF